MLNPELYRYLALKKDPTIFFQSKFAPPAEAFKEIECIGKSFFSELGNASYRSVYGTIGDQLFYRNAPSDLKKEAIVTSQNWVRNIDFADYKKLIHAEELTWEVVDDLLTRVGLEGLPNYPNYHRERFKSYCETPPDLKIETDGMLLAEKLSVFGSEMLGIKPADLVVLYLSDVRTTDILWMKQVVKNDIRTLVLSKGKLS